MLSATKIACNTEAEQNEVCGVRLIPGLKLFHFWEYRPFIESGRWIRHAHKDIKGGKFKIEEKEEKEYVMQSKWD